MKKILSVVVLLVGAILVFQGVSRKHSVIGEADRVGATVANKFDGGSRLPEHAVFIGSGGVLVAVGVWLTLQK